MQEAALFGAPFREGLETQSCRDERKERLQSPHSGLSQMPSLI